MCQIHPRLHLMWLKVLMVKVKGSFELFILKMSAGDAMWSPYRKPLGAVNTYDSWLASQEKRKHRLVVWNPLHYQIKNTQHNLTAERVEGTLMQHGARTPHLMFELFNLAFEVTDVLGWVCVIQLTLDLSLFLLLAEWSSVNQCNPWQQAKKQQYRLHIFTATAASWSKSRMLSLQGSGAKVSGETLSYVPNFLPGPRRWDWLLALTVAQWCLPSSLKTSAGLKPQSLLKLLSLEWDQ